MPKRDLVRRIDLNDGGLFGVGKLASGRTPQKYWGTLVVAASNSSVDGKAGANYICDGTDDHEEINQAIAAFGGGYKSVQLLEGTYNIGNDIVMYAGTTLEGVGDTTILNTGYKTPNNIGRVIDITGVSNVTIRKMKITNSYVFCTAAIWINGSTTTTNDIIIDNVLFEGCDNSYTISQLDNFTRIHVKDCRFVNNDAPKSLDFYCSTGTYGEDLQITGCSFYEKSDENSVAILVDTEDHPTAASLSDALIRNVLIANNMYSGNEISAIVGDWGAFLEMYGCVNANISDNIIERCDEGANLLDCFVVTIANNTMMYMGQGISCIDQLEVGSGGGSQWYNITGNTIYNHYNHAITIEGPSNGASYGDWDGERNNEDYRTYASITGNTIRYGHNTSSLHIQTAAQAVITGNHISDNASYPGIELYKAWLIHIDGNEIASCRDNIYMYEVYDINVHGNMIHDASNDGVWLREAYQVTITGNHFYNTGIMIADDVSGSIGTYDLIVANNTFHGGSLGYEVTHTNTTYVKNVFFGGSGGIGNMYSIADPPYLVDPPTNFLIDGNVTVGDGKVAQQIVATEFGYSEWSGGETSPGGLAFDGRLSRIKLTLPSGLSTYTINQLDAGDNARDGQIYVFSPSFPLSSTGELILSHTDNIHMDGGRDFIMTNVFDRIVMEYRDGEFTELSRTKAPSYALGSELVVNGDVETGSPANWTSSGAAATWSTAEAQSATHSLLIADTSSSWTSDSMSVSASTRYVLEFAYMTPEDGNGPQLSKMQVNWYNGAAALISSSVIVLGGYETAWVTYQQILTSPATAATAKIVFQNDTGGATDPEIHADDFSFRTYTEGATLLGISSGVLTVPSVGIWSIDPESGTADDIDTIDGGANYHGAVIYLRNDDATNTITLKDGTDNLDLNGGDVSLNAIDDVQALVYDGGLSKWLKV